MYRSIKDYAKATGNYRNYVGGAGAIAPGAVGGYRYGAGRPGVFGGGSYAGFQHMNGNANVLPAIDRTLQVTVSNSATTTASYTLFNYYQDPTDANNTVTISVAGSTHVRIKTEIGSNPFQIFGMKMNVTAAAQFNNNLTLQYLNGTGANLQYIWIPRSRISAQNESTTDIDAPDFMLTIDGHVGLSSTINASTTIVYTFFLSSKVELGNVHQGADVRKSTNLPPSTGHVLADIELMNRFGSLG